MTGVTTQNPKWGFNLHLDYPATDSEGATDENDEMMEDVNNDLIERGFSEEEDGADRTGYGELSRGRASSTNCGKKNPRSTSLSEASSDTRKAKKQHTSRGSEVANIGSGQGERMSPGQGGCSSGKGSPSTDRESLAGKKSGLTSRLNISNGAIADNSKIKRPYSSLFGGAPFLDSSDDESWPSPSKLKKALPDKISPVVPDAEPDGNLEAEPSKLVAPKEFSNVEVFQRQPARQISPVRSEASSWGDVREKTPPLYEFRDRLHKVATTYLDKDKSGNYDPEIEAKKLRNKKKPKSKVKKGAKKEKLPPKKIVRLHFESIGTVLNITDNQDNWPEGWSDNDSGSDSPSSQQGPVYRRRTPGLRPQEPIKDPVDEENDLTGHPAARGCKQCRKHNPTCSAIATGIFPCKECEEDEQIACEPIVIPGKNSKYKRAYINTVLYGPNRTFAGCDICRALGKKCSLKTKNARPPCKHCKKGRLGCTFYDTIQKNSGSNKRKEKQGQAEARKLAEEGPRAHPWWTPEQLAELMAMTDGETESDEENAGPVIITDTKGRRGEVTKFWTSFAHPIVFSSVATEHGPVDCNFCEMSAFGFVGHYEKHVDGLKWLNGLGYTEMHGGHSEEHGPTTMCQNCTMSRVQIMICDNHDITSIEGEHPNFDDAVDGLVSAEPRSDGFLFQLQRWCSMCFAVATYKCCTPQPYLIPPEGQEETLFDGCGLRLCDRCELKLRIDFQGNSGAMAASFDKEPKVRIENQEQLGAVVRADVGFLDNQGGLLMHNVSHIHGGAE